MKEFRFRLIIILAAVVLCVYLLFPTYEDYQNNKKIEEILNIKKQELKTENPGWTEEQITSALESIEDSIKVHDESYSKARQDRIKLGLDLQGGMRVVLEVNTAKLLEKIAKNRDARFNEILAEAENEAELSDESVVDILSRKLDENNIRLSRYFGSVREEDSEISDRLKDQAEDAVTRAVEIIRNRVDQYGVSEPSIQRQGTRRIIVELPGVAREEEAKQLLQGTALLEFKIVRDPEFTFSVMTRIDNLLAGKPLEDITSTDTTAAADTLTAENENQQDTTQQLTEEQFAKEHPFFALVNIDNQTADGFVQEKNRDRLIRIFNRPDIQNVIPNNVEFVFESEPIVNEQGNFYRMYLVNKEPELTGGVITDAIATLDPTNSQPKVDMEMNSEGATEWARITGANIGKRIAIILDGRVFSAPVVQNKIPGGRSQITGIGTLQEAKLLEIVLKAGALPAPVDIIEERIVGPSLGEDSINSGLTSFIFGYILTALFMIVTYQRSGSIAAFSLIFTVLFILGVLAGFKATLTLPGIAGIILTIAMAVDSNVLIYERIREELSTGKTIKASVDSGFSRALSAIIDSNVTTFFTGIILYQFGTGPVQGFALTLMIGIVASLVSALIICRLILDYMVYKGIRISVG